MFKVIRLFLFSIVLVASSMQPVPAGENDPYTFIAIGDTPYSDTEEIQLVNEVTPAIHQADPPFVAVYGDIKGGEESCSEDLLIKRRALFVNLAPGRIFYTPGDNEWTDCDRSFLKQPVSELGQLALVHKHFIQKPLIDIPDAWSYVRQDNFPENARWLTQGILFVTVHTVSTNNGRMEVLKDDIELALSMVEARDQANRVWLQAAFEEGRKQVVRAMVILTQADPTAADGSGACTAERRINCDAFAAFRLDLVRLSKNFYPSYKDTRRRPVLLVHGDTNPYCFDTEFGGDQAPNLWRLNAWGDYREPADATVITVQPGKRDTPFAAKTLLGGQVPETNCR